MTYAIVDPRDNAIIDWRDTRAEAQSYARELERSAAHPYRAYDVRLDVKSERATFSRSEHDMASKGFAYLAKSTDPKGLRKVVRDLNGFKRSEIIFDCAANEAAKIKGA